MYMCDGKMFSLGSFNFDYWSWIINHECNILASSCPMEFQHLHEVLKKVIQRSKYIRRSDVRWYRWVKIKLGELSTECAAGVSIRRNNIRRKYFKEKREIDEIED